MKKKEQPLQEAEEPIVNEEPDYAVELEVLQAQNEALASEVAALKEEVALGRTAREALAAQIARLLIAQASGSSADLKPEPPAKPVRPEVTIGEDRYRFKVGEVRLGRAVVLATAIAADEDRLAEVFNSYPGLFEKL